MKRVVKLIGALLVMVLAITSLALADNPRQMALQGYLTDNAGNPLNTTVAMTFTIYTDSISGTPRWSETQDVTVVAGSFNASLGMINSMPDSVFGMDTIDDGDFVWFEIKIGAETIGPRTLLGQAPFAGIANRVRGNDIFTGPNLLRVGKTTGPRYVLVKSDSLIYMDDSLADKTFVNAKGVVMRNTMDTGLIGPHGLRIVKNSTNDTLLTVGMDASGNAIASLSNSSKTHRIELNSETGEVVAMNTSDVERIGPHGFTVVSGVSDTTACLSNGNLFVEGTIKAGHSITLDPDGDKITATSGKIDFDNDTLVTTGKVGIGTTSPSAKLDVVGGPSGAGIRGVSYDGSTGGPSCAGVAALNYASSGNAGPGLYATSNKFHAVFGENSNNNAAVIGKNDGSGPGIRGQNQGTGPAIAGYASSGDLLQLYNIPGPNLRLSVSNSGDVYASGNVGIGTSSPSYKLDIQENSSWVGWGAQLKNTGSGNTRLYLSSDSGRVAQVVYETGDNVKWYVGKGTNDEYFIKSETTGDYFTFSKSGNFGIGTTAPYTTADINGDVALRAGSFGAGNGNNNNIDIGQRSFVRITGPGAAFSITGIVGGVDGKMLILYNTTGQVMTIANESVNSVPANRILTMTGANDATVGTGNVTLIYDATDQRWIVTALKP